MHHLFLIQDDAVRFIKNFLQLRKFEADLGLPLLAVDEIVDHAALDGAGAVKRVERGEIFDAGGLVAAENVPHAVGFELEDGGGFSTSEEFVGLGVVQGEIIYVDVRATALLDHSNGIVKHRERRQAKKIHFQQADALERVHIVLRGDFIAV